MKLYFSDLNVQAQYRMVVLAKRGELSWDYITSKLPIWELKLPPGMTKPKYKKSLQNK